MERSSADDTAGGRRPSDVAVADLPSESGAHWAHRDELLHRPAGAAPAPFRRPPAVNSFPDPGDGAGSQQAESWDAFAPSDNSGGTGAAWESLGESPKVDDGAGPRQLLVPAPPSPATSGRASFGVTDEPIGGPRSVQSAYGGPGSPAAFFDSGSPGAGAAASSGFSGPGGAPATPDAAAAPGSEAGAAGPSGFFRPGAGGLSAVSGSISGGPSAVSGFSPGGPSAVSGFSPGGPSAVSGSGADGRSGLVGLGAAEPSRFSRSGAAGAGAGDGFFSGDRAADRTATGDLPGIGEFLGGEGREIRPHRAGRRDHPAGLDPVHGTPAPPRRSRAVTVATVALSIMVLLAGAVAGVVFFAGSDGDLTSVLRLGADDADAGVATAPLAGRTAASFEMAAATTKITVRTQDLGEDLYRITAADESGTVPQPVVNPEGRVELQLSSDGERTSGTVEVLLNAKVTWSLRFVGATDEQILDLTGGRISSVDLAGGSRRVDLTLARATGTVPIRVTGAIDDLTVTSPAGNPVRVQVGGGAKTVTAGKRTLRDVSPGSTLTPKDWAVPDRYDVDAAARLTLLAVKTA